MTIDELDTGASHPARRYHHWLGGKELAAGEWRPDPVEASLSGAVGRQP